MNTSRGVPIAPVINERIEGDLERVRAWERTSKSLS